MSRPLRILVSGRIAAAARQGGASWAVLQYLLGFEELGHDVRFVEPITSSRIDPAGTREDIPDAAYGRHVLAASGMSGRRIFFEEAGGTATSISARAAAELTRGCDVFVNLSGVLRDRELTELIPIRVYVDLDPAFTQLWHEVESIDVGLAGHTHYVTVGQRLGQPGCDIPDCGVAWIPSLPPVVLRCWPESPAPPHGAVTTVGNWRGYGPVTFGDTTYGQRAHSFRPIAKLPMFSSERFSVALAIDPEEHDDLAMLVQNRWTLLDPRVVAGTPEAFANFVRASKAELDVPKSGYVVSRCGWFSDRSACYLASGRPVVAQDTGFSSAIPTGTGLIAFDVLDEAVDAIERMSSEYPRHVRVARQIAEEHFDARIVLRSLLDRIGV